jgi:hypothetical protein
MFGGLAFLVGGNMFGPGVLGMEAILSPKAPGNGG